MLVADVDGGILWYNQRWYEYTGSTPEQMNGWGWRSVHDPQVLPRVLERWKDSIASGKPFNMVFPPRGADGMFHPFLTRVMPVRNRDRKVVRWFGTNTDITEQQNSEAALREALELRQIAMRAAKLGAWEWRVGSGEVVWDENSQNMFGIQPGERSDYDAAIARIHPEDRARLTAAIQRAVEGANGGTFHNEFQVVWPNGSVHWVGAHGQLFPDGENTAAEPHFIGVNVDVTERKQAEEQIKGFNAELEAINRVLQEGLSSATQEELRRACLTIAEEATGSEFGLLGELNVDGRFEAVLVSDRARRPCGIAGGCRAEGAAFEAFGRLLGRFVSEDKGTYTNAPQTHPDQLDLPPGYPPLKAFLAIPLIHGETTIGVIGLGNRPGGYGVRDLRTAEALTPVIVQVLLRKRDQEAFREGEERFRALAEMVPSFLWMAQPDGSITHVNPRFEAYAGIPVASMLDNGWLEALHPEDADRAYQVWAEPIRTKSLYSIEYRIRRFDGRYRWFASRGLPMRNPSGEVTAWIGSITDVNDLKASEARLQRANKELRQFAYAAAHDLQEPLRNISTSISMLSLLHGQQMDAAATEWLNAGEAGAKRMHAMVQGLLSYMKSVEYTGPVNQVTASGEALDTAIANIELAIQESRARVIADALPSVGIPSPQMIQLFQNLIGNAVKYRKPEENPVIRVSARDDGIEVEFAISDNGIGFEPKYAEGIFGIFKRLHTQTEYSGSGMGLAICARIVSFYGGRIWAEGRPGKGATFHFTALSG